MWINSLLNFELTTNGSLLSQKPCHKRDNERRCNVEKNLIFKRISSPFILVNETEKLNTCLETLHVCLCVRVRECRLLVQEQLRCCHHILRQQPIINPIRRILILHIHLAFSSFIFFVFYFPLMTPGSSFGVINMPLWIDGEKFFIATRYFVIRADFLGEHNAVDNFIIVCLSTYMNE